MKNKAIPFLLGLVSLSALISCGETPTPSASSSSSEPASSAESDPASSMLAITYTDIDSVNLESGEYMVLDTIYAFDKENKKLTASKYEDYDSYKSKQGTVLYDGAVRFVKRSSLLTGDLEGVYFEINQNIYLLHKNSEGKVVLIIRAGSSETTSSAVAVSEIPLFSMGNYVSEMQTQNKANEEGSYIYDSQGNTIREEFYLFLELSETKASVFLGDNPTTHAETPLHSVENYKTLFVGGKLHIKIPHKDGEFALTLTSHSETEIKFVNAMEKKGDYSCSGTFTKIA